MTLSQRYQRDPRLDFFRGLALVCIFIDHTPGDRLTDFTIRNLGFSDASELFVLISAYAAGLVYMARANRDGLVSVGYRVWQRALQIYASHIAILVIVGVLAGWLSRTLNDPQFVRGTNVTPFLEHPWETFLHALALTYQPTFMNILPLYVVLLVFFPFMLWLIRRSQAVALTLSFAVYVAARQWPGLLHSPFGPAWEFNPLAWQLLFVIGASLGAAARGGTLRVPRSPVLLGLAAVYVLWAFWFGPKAWTHDASTIDLPQMLHRVLFPMMDRANLSLWRLASILALAYCVTWFVRPDSVVVRSVVGRPLVLLGQHSLPLFCVGVVLSVVGWVVFVRLGGGLFIQIIVNAGGIAIMMALAWLLSLRTGASGAFARPVEEAAVRGPA